MGLHVFISYASQDGTAAKQICKLLEQRQVPYWISYRNLDPGAEYPDEIIRAIENSFACVLLLSEHANESKFVKLEIERAISKGKPVFPVRLQKVEPSDALELFVSSHQWIEAWAPPLEPKIDKLAIALRSLVKTDGGHPQPVQPDYPARLPQRWARPAALLLAAVLIIALACWALGPRDGDRSAEGETGTADQGATVSPAHALMPAVAKSLDLAYQTARDGPSPQAAMDVWVQRPGSPGEEWAVLKDGESLSSVDRYRIAVRSQGRTFCYIFQVDTTGRLDWLFPRNGSPYSFGANPIEPGAWVQVPDGDTALQLDNSLGVEHIYAVATSDRWDEIESALEQARREGAGGASVTSHLGLRTRGVAGTVEVDRPPPSAGERSGDVTKLIQGLDGVLVREVWFRHVAPPTASTGN